MSLPNGVWVFEHCILESINVSSKMPQADTWLNHNAVYHADGQGKAASLVASNGSPVH